MGRVLGDAHPRRGIEEDASIVAARSPEGDRAVIVVSHGALLDVDMDHRQQGLDTEWFDPWTAERHETTPVERGYFQPPSSADGGADATMK